MVTGGGVVGFSGKQEGYPRSTRPPFPVEGGIRRLARPRARGTVFWGVGRDQAPRSLFDKEGSCGYDASGDMALGAEGGGRTLRMPQARWSS